MSEPTSTALRKRLKHISPVWLVPLIALLIGAWMLYHSLSEQGPEITLIMDNAEGIDSGQTLIKARNVEVGHVTSVTLSDDTQHVVARARMNNDTDRLLNHATRFWVVKPRIGREGISGLNTVLSGNYIQLQPGHSDQKQYRFRILDQPPVAPADARGLRLHLTSATAGAASVGDPVLFNGYPVGRVEKVNFDPDKREIDYQLFIQAPYEKLVTTNTRFWSAAGINFDVNSEGFTVNLASIESLISGGVAFGVPQDIPPGDPIDATSQLNFTLYDGRESAYQGSFSYYLRYVVLINGTVRGLNPGAPVEYRGVRVGTVDSVPWHIDQLSQSSLDSFKIPVLIRIEPQRLQARVDKQALDEWRQRMQTMFDHGLRASLRTGNIFTGQLFVDTSFFDDPEPPKVNRYDGIPVFPSQPGGFAQIEQKVTGLLDKLNGLEVGGTLKQLNRTLAHSDQLLAELGDTANTLNEVLDQQSTRQLPKNLQGTLESMQQTLKSYSRNAPAYDELTATLKQLNQLVRSLQPAARSLSDKPNSLIFNRDEINDPQPRAQP